MRHALVVSLASLLFAPALSSAARFIGPDPGGEAAPAAPVPQAGPEGPPPPAEGPVFELTLGGFWAFDGYTQNNFFLGKDAQGLVSDSDAYAIQIFRLQPVLTYGPSLKAVMRVDMAQGIWGVDDSQRDLFRPGFSNLFNNKDTNFEVHVDWAFLEATVDQLGATTFRLGRQKNRLGNLLVLDQNGDGLQVSRALGAWRWTAGWTKMWEGVDGLTDQEFSAELDGEDADLFLLEVSGKAGPWQLNPYLAYYTDRGDADLTTYIPQDLQYFVPRFTPNLSEALVLGLAFNAELGGFLLKGELDYLSGSDDVPNTDSGPNQVLDVNNGDLSGYNLFIDVKRRLGPGTLGAVFGRGSGDEDPMSGKGNINKIRTNGFFYLTEVWEDSIMPDEEGITPQGLGSPASRGYRELENTTLVQLNYAWPFAEAFKLFASGTLLRASEALRPWSDANEDGVISPGELGTDSSSDLGGELDARLDWSVMKSLTWTLRGGVFFPGTAAGYLINGSDAFLDNAWELRTTVSFDFSGLKLGTSR